MVTIQEFVATTKDQAAVEATAAAKQQWTLAANTALALDGAAVKVIDKLTVHWGSTGPPSPTSRSTIAASP